MKTIVHEKSRFVPALFSIVFTFLIVPTLPAEWIIPPTETQSWHYLDNGIFPGPGWTELTFDDHSWKSGQAPLGYNEPEVKTEVSFGPKSESKFITTYFRCAFVVKDPSKIQNLM